MKTLEIEEGETQLVIKVFGSSVGRIAPKDDPVAVHTVLLEILAEAPETKPPEEKEEEASSESVRDDGEFSLEDLKEATDTAMEALGEIFQSPKVQKAKKLFERLPKSKRMRERKRESG